MKIGAAQLRPAWLNRARTCQIVIDAIKEASEQGIELLVFSESFLSGYPFWICRTNGSAFDDPLQKRAYSQFLEAAVEVPGHEINLIVEASRDYGVGVYLGINERGVREGRGSIYCTLVAIHPERGLLGVHRKLVPTFDERLCWAPGDGHGLQAHDFGEFKVGGLNCWENWMPLARFALYAQGEDIHVSVWPGNASAIKNAGQLIATEGRVWVVSSSGLLSLSDVPEDFVFYDALKDDGVDVIFTGGSCIVDPSGQVVAQAEDGKEQIISFDADLGRVREERHNFDPTGHYSRQDVFRVSIDRTRQQAIHNHDSFVKK
ncbi:carbon-nitrogen hydrolase family protein [Pseudomonas sp. PDM03]|jgi:nitrilase|uniref:carbon-nitrogen hydrolase family protein n=1 Tax=Pseudomonas TaxID=286 RepID=UPI0017811EAA|nr:MULTISPECIES: carbon-nitrogen hydrolase family protein [Pseudomonas]MBD9588562.1 carbon-nitrogen hydrolase family protein [Pseudomonas sp. PDM03]MDZ5433289.1 carbon-nitrogen hydrolase family protein [Pseudomonas fluorescens]